MDYSSEFVTFEFCGYDEKGNLYLSACNREYGSQVQLARLASRSGSFELINLNTKLYTGFLSPSSVQWDGKRRRYPLTMILSMRPSPYTG